MRLARTRGWARKRGDDEGLRRTIGDRQPAHDDDVHSDPDGFILHHMVGYLNQDGAFDDDLVIFLHISARCFTPTEGDMKLWKAYEEQFSIYISTPYRLKCVPVLEVPEAFEGSPLSLTLPLRQRRPRSKVMFHNTLMSNWSKPARRWPPPDEIATTPVTSPCFGILATHVALSLCEYLCQVFGHRSCSDKKPIHPSRCPYTPGDTKTPGETSSRTFE